MAKKLTPVANEKSLRVEPPATDPRPDPTASALVAAVQQLKADVVDGVTRVAHESALNAYRNEVRGTLEREVNAAAERLRAEVKGLMDARGEDLRQRVSLVDALLRDLHQQLADGARRLEEVDRRVSPANVDDLVAKAARDTAEAVYSQRFEQGVEALTAAFDNADDQFRQVRAYVDQFGPGGLPVVAQERDALRLRVGELMGALELAQKESLTLKSAIADRDATALRRRVVEGIDPEVLDRRLAEVATRERDLDSQAALASDNQRLTTELERLRAALGRWEATGRAEETARVEAAQLQRYQNDAARADQLRLQAERAKSNAEARMRSAEDAAEQRAAELRVVEQERASMAERTRRLEAITEENQAFARQFEEQRRIQSENERRLRDAEVERADLQRELFELKREVDTATEAGRREEAEARAEALKARQGELNRWAEAEAESRALEHRKRADSLTTEVDRLRGLLVGKEGEIVRISALLLQAKAALEGAQFELAALSEAHQKRLALLEAEVRTSEARILAAAREEAARITNEAGSAAERALDEAEAHAARARTEAELDSTRLLGMADAAEAARNDLLAEIQERSAEKGELDAQIERLKADLWELKQRVVPAGERIRSLEEPVFAADDLHPVTTREVEEDWIKKLLAGIDGAGFVFHPRLVRAFHTSLKIAHHAPLVVLAGISGTGKSELPRLYADLGGVPFLPLAVQPSWDSPHDLFGFFNYTDGRLKAEPLARLFRQVGKPDDALRESPSLVLLDEMNLARVEYYFADLLSKLEARRSVRGSEDAARRRRASVLVDTGPEGGELPLYLDERVLFVGTMNQDESTLTLSDKVLDRACVLTFPAPRTMHLTKQLETPRRAERLSWQTWESWLREPAAGDNENRLNEANRHMADLGRPFGHRLFRAIHAYVENYPGSKEDAFSDQFAMKILPRLGGLECQSRKVRDGLDALGTLLPTELQAPFAAAREHEFFAWGGAPDIYQVDRA